MAPIIGLAISLATKFAPVLLDRLAGKTAGKVAEKVINIAQKVSGTNDPQEAHDKIMATPEMQMEFEKAAMNLEIELAREETKQLAIINATIQEELKSDGIKGFWRPYNGVLFGTTLFIDHLVMDLFVLFINVHWAHIEACKDFKWENIPFAVYIFWAMVLGVNGWTRGQEKLQKLKQQNGGQAINITEMLKNVGLGAIGL